MPVRAKVWRATDGRDFEDRAQARRHEAWLELVTLCAPIAEDLGVANLAEDMAAHICGASADIQRLLRAKPAEGGGADEP